MHYLNALRAALAFKFLMCVLLWGFKFELNKQCWSTKVLLIVMPCSLYNLVEIKAKQKQR